MNPHLMPKLRSDKIRREIRGKGEGEQFPCYLQLASYIEGWGCQPGTTVGCHTSVGGKGKGTKETDISLVAGCLHCHDILDGRNIGARGLVENLGREIIPTRVHIANILTLTELWKRGLIIFPYQNKGQSND